MFAFPKYRSKISRIAPYFSTKSLAERNDNRYQKQMHKFKEQARRFLGKSIKSQEFTQTSKNGYTFVATRYLIKTYQPYMADTTNLHEI